MLTETSKKNTYKVQIKNILVSDIKEELTQIHFW